MLQHISVVHQSKVISMGIAGVFQVGDAKQMELKSRALIVHREIPFYLKDEGSFEAFKIFTDEYITIPKRSTDVKVNIINECPFIEVNDVTIRTLLNSACFQIGSVDYAFNNSRIHQLRQYITDEPFNK
ncbi:MULTISPECIES: spore germination protein GerPE [Bacillus]|uniref:Spore germination protein GerPE n=1 Tax=Bacillus pseudomycoides TaxID=64104 RepID=A0ABD6T926_9BACI|nr:MULTISPECIES: spore germination protein GerPE [Bacillus]EEM06499.1 spore germination protein gerPE [Bacillus pseudomycoides]EEM12325.1 spore germination protein gerPE [Bacillus pseudomycoides]KFN15469.1 putative spore germination protein gerPE [Bacillus pseudomycoides]MDR4190788.1 spore germination protein GerPE [Bacillus pseudomycoides]MED0854885.1 spore germination protein GerPE [Bacillus pseudomycoides]